MKAGKISYFKQNKNKEIKFSILIPSWNNLSFLKLCVGSILKNSHYKHQIIIHVNGGTDGTLEWVRKNGFDYSHSEMNVGVCYAFNAAASLAKSDYLVLIDDDNYLLPDWDLFLWEETEKAGSEYFAISGTKIEHTKSLNNCVLAPYDFGKTPENFREKDLLLSNPDINFHDWNGSSWYPLVVHKNIWKLVGGLSVEFSPGMYSDPDFMMKLWQAGVRYFKGVGRSRSYHFISRSVSRVKKNKGRQQFLKKWGMSNSTFRKYYLRMGETFEGQLEEPKKTLKFRIRFFRDRIKLFFTC